MTDVYQAPKAKLSSPNNNSRSGSADTIRWVILVPVVMILSFFWFMIGGAIAIEMNAFSASGAHPIYFILGGLSAVLVISLAFVIAPTAKLTTAKIAYLIGGAMSALIIAGQIQDRVFGPFFYCAVSAIIAGGLCLFFLTRRSSKEAA